MNMSELPPKKDVWDKLQAVGILAGSIAIPIIIAFVGYWVNLTLKERDSNVRMIELSISILIEDPQKYKNTPQIREWAINILDKYSPVSLPSELKEELIKKPLPIGRIVIDPGQGGKDPGAYSILPKLKNRNTDTEPGGAVDQGHSGPIEK